MKTDRVFLDAEGNVVAEGDDKAVEVRELVIDDNGNVVEDTIYRVAK